MFAYGNVVDEAALRNKALVFRDRVQAGGLLGDKLLSRMGEEGRRVQVLAIPAGGVPVGFMVAKKLNAPLDVAVVRKIQIPWNPEAGFGALAWDGTLILNEALIAHLGLSTELVERCISKTRRMVLERVQKFRRGRPFPNLEGRPVILVDDGLASGYTMLTAVRAVRKRRPAKIVVAAPTGSSSSIDLLAPHVDELVCLNIRWGPFFAVADAYQVWYDLTDEEVLAYLSQYEEERT